MNLLHLDSSILGAHSVTRLLSAQLVAAELDQDPSLTVTYRDVVAAPFLHFSSAHRDAAHGEPVAQAEGVDLEAGQLALEEFLAADIIVIGAPMYNFAIPTQLRAWIDRVVVAGKTFAYDANGPKGLAGGKKILVASARGGAYADGPIAFLDHQESYLTAIFGFLGITDITFIRAENMARPDLREASLAAAQASITALAA